MSRGVRSITLSEWQTREPEDCDALTGRFLDETVGNKSVAETLSNSRMLELTELRSGLRVKAFSHVGRIQVGDLNVTVLPKLRGASMLRLLRYAYGFRRLKLISDTSHFSEPCGFEDLLVAQLNAEVQELLSRGLQRDYITRRESMQSPRGRIDIQQFAKQSGMVNASLACIHYPRTEDTLLNRVLLAGLSLAASITSNIELRRESRHLAGLMEEQVSKVKLTIAIMDQVDRQLTRLTKRYQPATSIIRLLLESQGVALEGKPMTNRLPGFMFDMNAFFQAIVSRFLRENLPDYDVIDEHSLKGMMQYNPNFRPARRAPTLRPDYVIKQGRKVCSIIDAKYRDIWEKDLPRHMLYQLVVYAVSHRDRPCSTIVYPTFHPDARESCIDVMDTVYGNRIGQVRMCPVNLEWLEALVNNSTVQGGREREEYAFRMAQLDG